ncbi:MAG: electron transport complex subunit RsxC [Thiothrix sp.]|nr:MAG: electron transport complex subunit RsxC [Thiothrix sp.]
MFNLRKLWQHKGGLHLKDYHKDQSTQQPVRQLSAAKASELVIPLQQHAGHKPKIIVKAGDFVYKGQCLAKAEGRISVPVHASTSGTIQALEERPIAHPSGLNDLCVILMPDGQDNWGDQRLTPLENYAEASAEVLRERISQAGIVGLGGAVFPSAIKLAVPEPVQLTHLLINGAECEPYITCDDMLMRERASEIITGCLIMLRALHEHAPAQGLNCLIGIEDNKPQAIQAMQTAVQQAKDPRLKLVPVPTQYPTGGERQLIQILTGREVPSSGRPSDIGVLCHNVATARAIYQAVVLGQPLISRYVTVTGKGVAQPQNFEVEFGLSMHSLIQAAGGYTPKAQRLIMGGSMMGMALPTDQIPVVKATNCLWVSEQEAESPALPCIRCGRCAEACPVNLLPQQLYWHARARNLEKVEQYHLFDCIECGCCAYVCPSHIPLVDYYRYAKADIYAQAEAREKADLARERHDFHQERLERAKREKAEKLAKHKEAAQTKTRDAGNNDKQAAIQAALERAKAKKAQQAASAPLASEDKPA